MLKQGPELRRELHEERLTADLVVVGGGIAGVCCSITAARAGAKVALVQDRPVLGGNASSEVRLWMVGATSHMGNNNRWAREGGVFDEICVENMHRNREGNPVIVDTILLEKVTQEPNITLLLNTTVFDIEKSLDGTRIETVRGFCSQNSTQYQLTAPLFCDSSGDGIVAFMAGAPFRYGAESRQEFGEMLAPNEEHKELLGQSIFFYTRDTGKPVRFVPPKYALDDITKIPRYRRINTKDFGCQLWWIEYGGSLDTVHDTERIKWELWRVVYGIWDYVKNSGQFPDAETMTLDWVGTIPGKRESRRFEGDYMLIQQDIVGQRTHYDAISFGGWAIDEHPVDSIYSDKPPCTQWHSKGVYQIPYRTMYSRSVDNLFLAGRIISASHIAFCSSRVMATCGHNAQAVGMAAALCSNQRLLPRDLASPARIGQLQQSLLATGQYIPGHRLDDPRNLARKAVITASSQFGLRELRPSNQTVDLGNPRAMLIPLQAGAIPQIEFDVQTDSDTSIVAQLRTSSRLGSFTPDTVLETLHIPLSASSSPRIIPDHPESTESNGSSRLPSSRRDQGDTVTATKATVTPSEAISSLQQKLNLDFKTVLSTAQYAFICLLENPNVLLAVSDDRVTGLLSLAKKHNHRVATDSMQNPPEGCGIDSFEFWTPERRPGGQNLAMRIEPCLQGFGPSEVINGFSRPTTSPNAWVAAFEDEAPTLTLQWDSIQKIDRVELTFDSDFDHPMESVIMKHHDAEFPFCVRDYRILGFKDEVVYSTSENYQSRNAIQFDTPLLTDVLKIKLVAPSPNVPASLFEIRCYGPE